jgi:ABC-2 type transport system permease protein
MKFRPGSIAWLMRHECRLHWRGLIGKISGKVASIAVIVVLHLFAIPVAFLVRHMASFSQDYVARALTMSGGLVLLLMISRSLITSVQALYARGDMDLLLSAPLAPRSIMSVRLTVIAASVTLEFAVLVLPFVNVFILYGMFAWAKAYVILPAIGLLATSISLVLALTLFRVVGPRRTRVIAQVMSALIAGGFMLLTQLPNIPTRSAAHSMAFGAYAAEPPRFDGMMLKPTLAIMAGWMPTLAFAAACAAVFALTSRQLAGGFIRASIASASISVGQGSRRTGAVLRFRGNTRAIVIRKECRLIRRDPWLITQLLQQSIFLIPMGIVLSQRSGRLPIVWGLAIFLAGLTAGALAWITVTAEDVPELVAAAPIAPADIVRYKLQAALWPILPIALAPLPFLWGSHAWLGFCIAISALGAAVSCAVLNVRARAPGRRRDFRSRNKGNLGRGFIELAILFVWTGVCALMVFLSPWR